MNHKHLLMRVEVLNPPKDRPHVEAWLVELVNKIGMVLAAGPISAYITKEGNEGLTACVLIETSHITMHVWDEATPPFIQFDLYSCKEFKIDDVIDHFNVFHPVDIKTLLIDRNNEKFKEGINAEGVEK